MANINVNELTKDQVAKAMACETAEELMALAKAEGVEITKEEAEAYMDELTDVELDGVALRHVAGGNGNCTFCPCQSDYQGRTGCSDLGTHS